jgi:hypothetical protein
VFSPEKGATFQSRLPKCRLDYDNVNFVLPFHDRHPPSRG